MTAECEGLNIIQSDIVQLHRCVTAKRLCRRQIWVAVDSYSSIDVVGFVGDVEGNSGSWTSQRQRQKSSSSAKKRTRKRDLYPTVVGRRTISN